MGGCPLTAQIATASVGNWLSGVRSYLKSDLSGPYLRMYCEEAKVVKVVRS
jgi:hypothetical protein